MERFNEALTGDSLQEASPLVKAGDGKLNGHLFDNFLRRRKFIVKRGIQLRLLFITIAYVLFFCLILAAALFIPLMVDLHTSDASSSGLYDSATQILYLHTKFWPSALLALVAVGLHSILISHKIAGPLFRFSKTFKEIKEGRIPKRIYLRKGDYLLQEMELINSMIDALEERYEAVEEAKKTLSKAACRFGESEKEMSKEELLHRMHEVEILVRECEDTLNRLEKKQGKEGYDGKPEEPSC